MVPYCVHLYIGCCSSVPCCITTKSGVLHPQILRHYGEPGLVAPCAWKAYLSGACPALLVIHQAATSTKLLVKLTRGQKLRCGSRSQRDNQMPFVQIPFTPEPELGHAGNTALVTATPSPSSYQGRGLQGTSSGWKQAQSGLLACQDGFRRVPARNYCICLPV